MADTYLRRLPSGRLVVRKKEDPLHQTWRAMIGRTTKVSYSQFKRYGARGIRVCEEWRSYEAFRAWAIGAGYRRGLTIDRIDNDGHYEPGNCRWATAKVQARNRSSTSEIAYNGKVASLAEHIEDAGLKYQTVYARLRHGWPIDRALRTPARPRCNPVFVPDIPKYERRKVVKV